MDNFAPSEDDDHGPRVVGSSRHATNDDDDDDGLGTSGNSNVWDELNQQHHWEMTQHYSRSRGRNTNNSDNNNNNNNNNGRLQSWNGSDDAMLSSSTNTAATSLMFSSHRPRLSGEYDHRASQHQGIAGAYDDEYVDEFHYGSNHIHGGGGILSSDVGAVFISWMAYTIHRWQQSADTSWREFWHITRREWQRLASLIQWAANEALTESQQQRQQQQSVSRSLLHSGRRQRRDSTSASAFLDDFGFSASDLHQSARHGDDDAAAAAASTTDATNSVEMGYTALHADDDDDHDADHTQQQPQQQRQRPSSQVRFHPSTTTTTTSSATTAAATAATTQGHASRPKHHRPEDAGAYVWLPSSPWRGTAWFEQQQQQQQHRRLQQQEQLFSRPPRSLDDYFTALYHYYAAGGMTAIVCQLVVDWLSLVLTVVLSILLFAYLDWSALAQCVDEHTCRSNLQDYIASHPFSSSSSWHIWNFVLIVYIFLALIWIAWSAYAAYATYQQASMASWVFAERLGISEDKLQGGAVDWDADVVQALQRLHATGQYRIIIDNSDLHRSPIMVHNHQLPTNAHHNAAGTTPPPQQQQSQSATARNNNSNNSNSSTYPNDDNNPMMIHPHLDALYIAHRILRKDNFMIALHNAGLLDVRIAWLGGRHRVWYGSTLQWCIHACVLNYMFNHRYELRPAFYLDPASLQRRFQWCGLFHAIFMPFVLFFMTLHFVLRHVYDWKTARQYLGPRCWSLAATWQFREFNELPHCFERRMVGSYKAAEQYLSLFGANEWVAAIGRMFVLCAGSLGAVLLAFAAMNDAILLHVKIAQWNLLWYVGVVGIVYSTGKGMIPTNNNNNNNNASAMSTNSPGSADSYPISCNDQKDQYGPMRHDMTNHDNDPCNRGKTRKVRMMMMMMRGGRRNVFAERNYALEDLAIYTHYLPNVWKRRGHDSATHRSIQGQFQPKAEQFVQELISTILTPFILAFTLAGRADDLCEYILSIRNRIPGLGDVCGYAQFDFDIFTDESSWHGRTGPTETTTVTTTTTTSTTGSDNHHHQRGSLSHKGEDDSALLFMTETLTESILRTGNVEQATHEHPKPKSKHGKMEQSFFSFQATHPSWKCSTASGRDLANRRLAQQEVEERVMLEREQALHMEVNARQLETFAQLQEQQQKQAVVVVAGGGRMDGMRPPVVVPNLAQAVNENYLGTTTAAVARKQQPPLPETRSHHPALFRSPDGMMINRTSRRPYSTRFELEQHRHEAHLTLEHAGDGPNLV